MGRSSAIDGCKWDFLNGHIFDQVDLLAVTYDSINNLMKLSYADVTSETKNTWMWSRS